MPSVNVQVQDVHVKAPIDEARKNRYLNVYVQDVAMSAERQVRLLTPGSGRVRSMWTTSYERNESGRITRAIIHNTFENQDILVFLEGGTRPHGIDPLPNNKSGRLVFYWDAIGKWVFAVHVDHPGTKVYRMVELTHLALQMNVRMFLESFEANLTRMTN